MTPARPGRRAARRARRPQPRPRRRRSPRPRRAPGAPRGRRARRALRRSPDRRARARTTRRGAARSPAACGLGRPVVHRNDHERRARVRSRPRGRPVRWTPARSCGAHRVVDPHRVVPGEPLQPPGEERLRGEVAAVLLPDEDDERRPVDARRGEGADRVAEARRRVQDRERGLSACRSPSPSPSRRRSSRGGRARTARSSGRSASSAISVEPGFAKSVVRPCSRRTSKAASRTVGGTMATLLEVI